MLQQSSAEVLVFIDCQEKLSQNDLEDDEDSILSFQTNCRSVRVLGKLKVIDFTRSATTEAFSFISQLSEALQQPQDGWYNCQDLSRYLSQREELGSVRYTNFSSPADGESLALVRNAPATDAIPFTFDIKITTTSDETTLSKQIYDWCLSCPPAVKAMSLSTHRSAKEIGERELTNLLTL